MVSIRMLFKALSIPVVRVPFLAALMLAVCAMAIDEVALGQQPSRESALFAAGTLTVIEPEAAAEETTIGPLELDELTKDAGLNWAAPEFPDERPFYETRSRVLQEMAKQVRYRREIYCMEFSFKPMRQLEADLPQPDGSTKKKVIWYLVFRIRYQGLDLRPTAEARQLGGVSYSKLYPKIAGVTRPSRYCFPMLALRSEKYEKEYLDRVLPSLTQTIAQREKIYSKLYNTVEITSVPVPHTDTEDAEGVWGVATWEDLDPRIDFFSVYVSGLTNATHREADGTVTKKVLQLNFFRPGDTIKMVEDTIRFGIPAFQDPAEFAYALKQYNVPERLDYRWVFR